MCVSMYVCIYIYVFMNLDMYVGTYLCMYSKTCLKRNAIIPIFFFRFHKVSALQRDVF